MKDKGRLTLLIVIGALIGVGVTRSREINRLQIELDLAAQREQTYQGLLRVEGYTVEYVIEGDARTLNIEKTQREDQ